MNGNHHGGDGLEASAGAGSSLMHHLASSASSSERDFHSLIVVPDDSSSKRRGGKNRRRRKSSIKSSEGTLPLTPKETTVNKPMSSSGYKYQNTYYQSTSTGYRSSYYQSMAAKSKENVKKQDEINTDEINALKKLRHKRNKRRSGSGRSGQKTRLKSPSPQNCYQKVSAMNLRQDDSSETALVEDVLELTHDLSSKTLSMSSDVSESVVVADETSDKKVLESVATVETLDKPRDILYESFDKLLVDRSLQYTGKEGKSEDEGSEPKDENQEGRSFTECVAEHTAKDGSPSCGSSNSCSMQSSDRRDDTAPVDIEMANTVCLDTRGTESVEEERESCSFNEDAVEPANKEFSPSCGSSSGMQSCERRDDAAPVDTGRANTRGTKSVEEERESCSFNEDVVEPTITEGSPLRGASPSMPSSERRGVTAPVDTETTNRSCLVTRGTESVQGERESCSFNEDVEKSANKKFSLSRDSSSSMLSIERRDDSAPVDTGRADTSCSDTQGTDSSVPFHVMLSPVPSASFVLEEEPHLTDEGGTTHSPPDLVKKNREVDECNLCTIL